MGAVAAGTTRESVCASANVHAELVGRTHQVRSRPTNPRRQQRDRARPSRCRRGPKESLREQVRPGNGSSGHDVLTHRDSLPPRTQSARLPPARSPSTPSATPARRCCPSHCDKTRVHQASPQVPPALSREVWRCVIRHGVS